jgi:hypothetical protein
LMTSAANGAHADTTTTTSCLERRSRFRFDAANFL